MKNNYKNLYVFNPDTNTPVPAEDWLKDADPTRAQLFGFKSGDGILLMTKSPIAYGVTFDEAQKLAANFSIKGTDLKFRCITRRAEGESVPSETVFPVRLVERETT